jgi:hypothetical protein
LAVGFAGVIEIAKGWCRLQYFSISGINAVVASIVGIVNNVPRHSGYGSAFGNEGKGKNPKTIGIFSDTDSTRKDSPQVGVFPADND